MKEKMLFIAPLTTYHGQGSVSIQAKNALEINYDLKIINSFTKSYSILNHFTIPLRIIINCRKFKYIYFTPSRNFFSSIRDFLLLLIAKKDANIVGHLHGSDLFNFLNYRSVYHKYLFFLYKLKLNKLIILSESHSKYALGNNFDRYEIINNPLEIDLNFSKETLNHELTEMKFCSLSNPIKSKGLDRSINFISNRFNNYNWHLDVIGWTRSDYEKTYNKEINPNLSNRLTFHGRKNGYEKYKLLLNSSYFIFLSYYKSEAQPIVLYEALLSGCKIIVSDYKMLKDFKKYNNVYMDYEINSEKKVLEFIKQDYKNDNFLKEDLSLKNFNLKLTNAFI